MNDNLTFELLALDPDEETRCHDAQSLLFMIRGFSELWNAATVSESDCRINDGEAALGIIPVDRSSDGETAADFGRAFFIVLTGPFNAIEARRVPLTGFLKDQGFRSLYVVRDEASQHIACSLYPHLYKIENLLRGYLIKFMSTRIGPGWWENTVTRDVVNKAKMRKKNETVFGRHVDNSAYLIDFGELGEIVYTQTSGFVTREDIVKRIERLEESPEAIRELKNDLQTNYKRFFKDSFADRQFRDKWREFEALRNKIAHNNLFIGADLERGNQLAEEIEEIIRKADEQTPQLKITPEEREAIQDIVVQSSDAWNQISDHEFLKQLGEQERRFHGTGGFVGISRFVKFHLGAQGYNFRASYEVANRLEEEGKIETYQVENPGGEHTTTAIRLADNAA